MSQIDPKRSFRQTGLAQAVQVGIEAARTLRRQSLRQVGEREVRLCREGRLDLGARLFHPAQVRQGRG